MEGDAMSIERVIAEACGSYASRGFFVGASITGRKRQNIMTVHEILHGETVYGLIDMTVFGSAKHSAVFTSHKLSVHNAWGADIVRSWALPWDQFAHAKVAHSGKKTDFNVYVDQFAINTAGSALAPAEVATLLRDLQQRLRNMLAPSEPEAIETTTEDVEWMVAVNGETFGPYTERAVIRYVAQGRFDRTRDYVWRTGMPDWRRMEDVDVFRRNTPPPPPPGAENELPPLPGGVPRLPKRRKR